MSPLLASCNEVSPLDSWTWCPPPSVHSIKSFETWEPRLKVHQIHVHQIHSMCMVLTFRAFGCYFTSSSFNLQGRSPMTTKMSLATIGNSQSSLVRCWIGELQLALSINTCLVMNNNCFVLNAIPSPLKSKNDILTLATSKLKPKDYIFYVQQFDVNHWIAISVVSLDL